MAQVILAFVAFETELAFLGKFSIELEVEVIFVIGKAELTDWPVCVTFSEAEIELISLVLEIVFVSVKSDALSVLDIVELEFVELKFVIALVKLVDKSDSLDFVLEFAFVELEYKELDVALMELLGSFETFDFIDELKVAVIVLVFDGLVIDELAFFEVVDELSVDFKIEVMFVNGMVELTD